MFVDSMLPVVISVMVRFFALLFRNNYSQFLDAGNHIDNKKSLFI